MAISKVLSRLLAGLLLAGPAHAATVTFVANTADTDATPNTSAAFSPSSNDLLVVFVVAMNTAQDPCTLTSSTSLTFTQNVRRGFASDAHGVYSFVADALVSDTSSQTVTFNCSSDAATGTHITIYRVAGMSSTGLSAIRQDTSSGGGSGATPETTFTEIGNVLTTNPTLGAVGNGSNPAGMTHPSGWTEATDAGYATPDAGISTIYRDSGFSGATVTWGSSATAWGMTVIELDSSAAAPTFTSAPAIGTRTTSSIPINFTSDQTGTVYGAAVTDGNTCTCDNLEAQSCSGGYKYFSEAVVATVADSATFTSYTDGTVRDGQFCIENGSGTDSTVASINNMYKIPAFTTPLTITSQTETTYTTNSKVLDGAGLVDLVACVKDATAPSVAQVEAGTGGCILNGSEDDATGTMTLDPSGTAHPIYDLYYVGSYGGQSEAAVHALPDELLDAPSGQQHIIKSGSPGGGQLGLFDGASPAIADGDVMNVVAACDSFALGANAHTITVAANTTYVVNAESDTSRQACGRRFYDASAVAWSDASLVAYYINNQFPVYTGLDAQEGVDPYLFEKSVAFSHHVDTFFSDAEGDALTLVVTNNPSGGTVTGGNTWSSVGGFTTFGIYTTVNVAATDIAGDSNNQTITVSVGVRLPDVVTWLLDETLWETQSIFASNDDRYDWPRAVGE